MYHHLIITDSGISEQSHTKICFFRRCVGTRWAPFPRRRDNMYIVIFVIGEKSKVSRLFYFSLSLSQCTGNIHPRGALGTHVIARYYPNCN